MLKHSRVITAVVGIASFCCMVVILARLSGTLSVFFINLPVLLFVVFGGVALAFAKMPKSINDLLRYFSKTSLLSGAIGAVLPLANFLLNVKRETQIFLGNHLSLALMSMFYGLFMSVVSYVLCQDKNQ